MKIKEILTPEPQRISPEATLMEAAAQMKKWDVGFLPVCREKRVVGIITDRDITIRGVARGTDPNATRVFEIMSGEIQYCHEDEEVEKAGEIMETRRVRRLPVLNRARELVGVISLGDLVARIHKGELAGRVLRHVSMGRTPSSPQTPLS